MHKSIDALIQSAPEEYAIYKSAYPDNTILPRI